ncbi:MAG: hypothetical protein CMG55_09215 [Candidatus Marinimicrobia bacterium]|nr:hypothetical protein [Candidatus Neomarinimicrobiota bacterium]
MAKKSIRQKKKLSTYKNLPLDIAIFVVGILLLSFIYSFSRNTIQSGIPIEVTFPEINEPRKLARDVYQTNPIKNIKVEVLNGCGIKGIAAKTSEFLRIEHRIDVIKSDNADRYDYPKTMIIGRNEDLDKILSVSKAFDISIHNEQLIKHDPDETLGVDVTIILGKDIISYEQISSYIENDK